MFGNRRKKLQKLGEISSRFSRENGIVWEVRSNTRKYVFLRFQNTSKFVKNARLRLAISTLLGVWKSEEVLLVFELLLEIYMNTKC